MDPPIKLFGQTIAVTGTASSQNDVPDGDGTSSTGAWEQMSSSPQDGAESGAKTDLTISNGPVSCFLERSSSGSTGRAKLTPSPSEGYGLMLSSAEPSRGTTAEDTDDMDAEDMGQAEGASSDGGNQHGEAKGPKMPRRPDKAVACPRCHSLETKFCYYNNYNVKQPRHFCKHCQRYWTAGGTLRNVPVGAGRRKNKHGSVVSPRQMTEMMGFVRGDESDAVTPIVVGKGVALPAPVTVPPVPAVLGGTLACSSESVMRAKGGSSDGSGTDAVYSGRGWESKDMPCRAATSAPCGSPLLQDVKGETSGSPEGARNGGELPSPPSNGGGEGRGSGGGPQGAGAQSNTNGSFGFFNGGWPYAYNVGWNGGAAAAFCGNEVAGLGNALPPPTPANVAAWSGAAAAWNGAGAGNMWTGIPWPVPDLAWSPTGWAPPWHIAPWAMGAVAAGTVVAMSPPVGTGGVVAGAPVPVPCPTGATSQPSVDAQAQAQPQPQPQPQPRTSEGLRPPEAAGAVWAPKSLRMVDRDEAKRSSVWTILGVGSHPDLTAAGTTFKSFQPKPETEKAG